MITPQEAAKIRRLVRRLLQANDRDSWKGGGDPDDWPEIAKQLSKARKDLNLFLQSITDIHRGK